MNYPWKGNIYSIRDIISSDDKRIKLFATTTETKDVKCCFLLEEIYNFPIDFWWFETYFRPLEFKSVDDLQSLLNNIPKDIQEEEKKLLENDKEGEKEKILDPVDKSS